MSSKQYTVFQKVDYHKRRRKQSVYSNWWLNGVTDEHYENNLRASDAEISRMRKQRIGDKGDWQVAYGNRNGLRHAKAYYQALWKKHNNWRDVEAEMYETRWGEKRR